MEAMDEWGQRRRRLYQEKNAPMRDLIESFGTEITAHARYQMTEKRDLTTTYLIEYIPPSNDDDELAA